MPSLAWPNSSLAAVVFVLMSCVGAVSAAESRPTVVFFVQGEKGTAEQAWTTSLRTVAEVAAEDLELDYETVHIGTSREQARIAIHGRIEREDAPDYVLLINYRSFAGEMLQYFEEKQVYSFLFNAGLTEEEHLEVGRPGEKLKYWIGELTPDDEKAGYDLARYLIDQAKAQKKDEIVQVLGITGSYANPVAISRVRGLKRAVLEDPDADLVQIVSARWGGDVAGSKFEHLLRRYPGIDVVWAANDEMAMGVVRSEKRPPNILIGGMDWTQEGRAAIARGDLTASMGGHYIDTAYALTEIAAHAKRSKKPRTEGLMVQKSSLTLLTQSTLSSRVSILNDARLRELDFSCLLPAALDPDKRQEVSIDAFLATQNHKEPCP